MMIIRVKTLAELYYERTVEGFKSQSTEGKKSWLNRSNSNNSRSVMLFTMV